MSLAIVLVRPEIPENVGFIARTLKCFHLSDLRIVGRDPYPPKSKAHKTGTAALEILEGAGYFPTLEEALAPFSHTFAFSKRHREIPAQRCVKLENLIPTVDFRQPTALVFGPEAQGLSKADCLLADKVVSISLPNPGLSLNLSHAVAVTLQEIWRESLLFANPFFPTPAQSFAQDEKDPGADAPLPFSEKEFYYNSLRDFLLQQNIIGGGKKEAKLTYLRELWHRLDPKKHELDFLMGLLNSARKARRH